MIKKWHVLFCDDAINFCPVTEFINKAKPSQINKFFHIVDQLEIMGPNMTRPYSDILHDGIHELRIKLSGQQYRFLYFFCYERFIVLFQVFIKNTDKVPEKMIKMMIDYREHLLERTSEKEMKTSWQNKNHSIFKSFIS